MKFLICNPEQAYLLPPSVRDVLGEGHVSFFLHRAVERLDLSTFEQGYVEEGRPADHPVLLLKVWLYAYVLGLTSARRRERIEKPEGMLLCISGFVPKQKSEVFTQTL